MNRLDIKKKAKAILKENFKVFWEGYLIIFALSFVLNLGIGLIFGSSMIGTVLSLVASCFSMTLSVGFYSYLLKMIRKESFSREDIFKFINKVLPIIVISLLVGIFCFLWSILFIIPGIIAALSYSMVYYIFTENSELTAMDYLEKSKKMMNGYKLDYFLFNLSFMGWMILSILTLGLLLIWTLPYFSISQALYYDELKKKNVDNL